MNSQQDAKSQSQDSRLNKTKWQSVVDLSVSAKLIAVTLDNADEPLQYTELRKRTLLSKSTFSDGVGELLDVGAVKRERNISDPRTKDYSLSLLD